MEALVPKKTHNSFVFVLIIFASLLAGCQTLSPEDRAADSCDGMGRLLRFTNSHEQAPAILLRGSRGPAVPPRVRWTNMRPINQHGHNAHSQTPDMGWGIGQCNTAIEQLTDQENWMRKATLLRARGTYQLVGGNKASAIADFDAAREMVAQAGDPEELQQGFVTTLNLLMSIAYDNHLERHSAKSSIDDWLTKASNAYPYSEQLQSVVLRRLSPKYLKGDESALYKQQAMKLSPKVLHEIADIEEWLGDPQHAYNLHQILIGSRSKSAPASEELIASHAKSAVLAARMKQFSLAKDHENRAMEWLAIYRADHKRAKEADSEDRGRHPNLIAKKIGSYQALSKGFELNETADDQALRDYLEENTNFLYIGNTFHLLSSIEEKRGLKFSSLTDVDTMFTQARVNPDKQNPKLLVQAICELIPTIVDAQSQGGMSPSFEIMDLKHSGYKVTPLGENRIEVLFTREHAGAAQIQEMALLKAAMVALKQGKSWFYVEDVKSYRFVRTKTYDGFPTSSKTTGFRSKVVVQLLDAPHSSEQPSPAVQLNAAKVVEDLSPKYL
jgi:hypothetical protein